MNSKYLTIPALVHEHKHREEKKRKERKKGTRKHIKTNTNKLKQEHKHKHEHKQKNNTNTLWNVDADIILEKTYQMLVVQALDLIHTYIHKQAHPQIKGMKFTKRT